ERASGSGSAARADPQMVRAERTHGAETPDETGERYLPQAQPERRSSVRSACYPRLRPIPVTRGDGGTSGVVVVLSDAQPAETVAVRPGAGRPRSGGRDRPITELGSFLSTLR